MKLYDSGEYRATKQWPYSISAGCCVFRSNGSRIEVLLLLRRAGEYPQFKDNDADTYHLPKGHSGFNERIDEAAIRETEEEAGVTVRLETYLGTRHWVVTHPVHKLPVDKTTHYFAAEWQSDLPEKDDEHSGAIWASLEDAEKLLGPPNPKGEDEIVRRLKTFLEITK
jgi:8-oxo-dGTP pyrophosphatase MutT (NUDIX family)